MGNIKQYAIKFRIYPNKEQEEKINNNFRTSKFIYNLFLSIEEETTQVLEMYGSTKDEIRQYKTDNKLWFDSYKGYNRLKKMLDAGHFLFVKEFPSSSRSYVLKSLENAFKNIKKMGAGFPKYKKINNSYTFQIRERSPMRTENNNSKWNKITLPNSKLGKIKINIHRKDFLSDYENLKCNSATISKNGTGYYVSLQMEDSKILIPKKKSIKKKTSIGIDLGVTKPVVTSRKEDMDIDVFNTKIEILRNSLENLGKLNIILSKKRLENKDWKGSNKYQRIKNKISKVHSTIKNQREWIQHNISSSLINLSDVDTYILEDLSIKNMTGKAKPKQDKKGKYIRNNKKQKSGLNKSILDVGFFEIKRQLEYKSEWCGKNVVSVDPKFTSQQCNECGHTSKDNRKSQSEFSCVECGHEENADFNAAKNIKDKYFNK